MIYPLVSIIIPIYKVEPYLRRCLDSVIHQKYTNLEIILVDDGSPDGCPQICDEYAARDKRIVVIHKENGGLSDARNAGLDICKGEYIYFIDSDDIIPSHCIDILLKIIIQEKAEIALSSYEEFSDAEPDLEQTNQNYPYATINGSEALILLCRDNTPGFMSSCMKIYKRECFDRIRFPLEKLYEDARTNYKIYHKCHKICYTKKKLYYYRIRKGSIMANTKGLIYDLDAREERYAFLAEHNEIAAQYCLEQLCWDNLVISTQPVDFFKTINFSTSPKIAYDNFKKYGPLFLKTNKGRLSHRFLIRLFLLFPRLYPFLYKISPIHFRKTI